MRLSIKTTLFYILLFFVSGMTFSSCKKYVDAGSPVNLLTPDKVFTDSTATLGTVLALYSNSNINGTTNTTVGSASLIYDLCMYGAMSADEGYLYNNSYYDIYKNNTLPGGASYGNVVYNYAYFAINYANKAIEGISGSTSFSSTFKNQLIGECEFWRAYAYFNLVNYYGAVPLVINTNVAANAVLPRAPAADVYKQMVIDLTDAKTKVSVAYPSAEKARVNQATVSALLARVYLYQQKWDSAEYYATQVIGSGTYSLESNLNNVFVKTSNETIWQTISNVASGINGVTKMGAAWIPSGTVPIFVLYDTLAKTFEPGDQRLVNWTKSMSYNGGTLYYPYKYKIRAITASGNEYNVMFRLAEQYLIRSEARAMQNNISGAQDDLNIIRNRAGLANTTASSQVDLLTALEHERWVELFTEMSDRWYNLKRTGRINTVLPLTKAAIFTTQNPWQSFQALYPIPQSEFTADPNLLPNNPGY
jgi:hypothetical protein